MFFCLILGLVSSALSLGVPTQTFVCLNPSVTASSRAPAHIQPTCRAPHGSPLPQKVIGCCCSGLSGHKSECLFCKCQMANQLDAGSGLAKNVSQNHKKASVHQARRFLFSTGSTCLRVVRSHGTLFLSNDSHAVQHIHWNLDQNRINLDFPFSTKASAIPIHTGLDPPIKPSLLAHSLRAPPIL